MIGGGKTLSLSPDELAKRAGLIRQAGEGVDAAAHALRDRWEFVLRSGTPVGLISGKLAGSIRVTKLGALARRVGTPVFYGRILHHGVPGRLEPRPHGEIALNAAERDMNDRFRKAMR